MEKTWIMLADFHSGSTTGLTSDPNNEIQEKLLQLYKSCIAKLGIKPNVVILDGDGIDGADKKGKDIDTSIINDQVNDAAKLLLMWDAVDEYIIVSGTPYHTSVDGEPLDINIKSSLSDQLRMMGNVTTKTTYTRKDKSIINGWFRLETRHKIGRSTIPHGKSTPQVRAKIWNVLNAALKHDHWAHLIVFAHVHYWNLQRDSFGTVLSLPCWQAIGSRYGDEECDGHIDIGALKLIVGDEPEWNLTEDIYPASMTSRWESR